MHNVLYVKGKRFYVSTVLKHIVQNVRCMYLSVISNCSAVELKAELINKEASMFESFMH